MQEQAHGCLIWKWVTWTVSVPGKGKLLTKEDVMWAMRGSLALSPRNLGFKTLYSCGKLNLFLLKSLPTAYWEISHKDWRERKILAWFLVLPLWRANGPIQTGWAHLFQDVGFWRLRESVLGCGEVEEERSRATPLSKLTFGSHLHFWLYPDLGRNKL